MTDARRREIDSWIILISAPLLLIPWWYYGKAPATRAYAAVLTEFGSFFALCFVLPLLFSVARLKRPLADLGLGGGDLKRGLPITAGLLVAIVAVAWLGSRMPEVRGEYPLCRAFLTSRDGLPGYEAAYALLYYVAWEFYFRGFLLFGLKDDLGAGRAVLIQTMASALVHLGKPPTEALGSIPFSLIMGFLALRTRSIWYGWILHASLGVLTDLFVIHFP